MLRIAPLIVLTGLVLAVSGPANAYVGPGAGVSLLGALFGVLSMLGLFFLSLLRWALRSIFGLKAAPKTKRKVAPEAEAVTSAPAAATADVAAAAASGEASRGGVSSLGLVLVAGIMFFAGLSYGAFTEGAQTALHSGRTALGHLFSGLRDPKATNLYMVDRLYPTETGVITHAPGRAAPGFNLETTATLPSARLLTMDGTVVHEWQQDREAMALAWLAAGEAKTDLSGLHWRRVKPLADGSLIVIVENNRTTPYGFGVMKLGPQSSLEWMLPGHYHHSLDVTEDGTIYTLYQELHDEAPSFLPRVSGPILREGIAVLSADGEELRRYDITEAFRNTPYESFLRDVRPDDRGDPLHINTVEVVRPEIAATTSFAKAGDILFSLRNTNTVGLLDPESGKVTWAVNDLWHAQHEPQLTGHDHLLLFDNQGPESGQSRAIEWDLSGAPKVVWTFDGTAEAPLISEQYGVVRLLPNGNRLISETYGGRALEVDQSGEIVWEWRSSFRKPYGRHNLVARLMEVERVAPDFFTGEFLSEALSDELASLDLEEDAE